MQPVGVVQRLASSGYSFVDPAFSKARSMVPLLDTTARRIEQHIPVVIKTADQCVDAVYKKGEAQVIVLQTKKAELVNRCCYLALVSVERSEALVDRVLPEDTTAVESTKALRKSRSLPRRAVAIPMQVPLRGTRFVVVQAESLAALLAAQGRCGMSAAMEKVLAVRGASSRQAQAFWRSANDAAQAVVVCVNGQYCVFCNWTAAKAQVLKQGGSAAVAGTMQGAFVVTKTVIGTGRAVLVFTKVGEYVPALKVPAVKETSAAQSQLTPRKQLQAAATARNAAAAQRAAEELQALRASELATRQIEARKVADELQAKRAALSSRQ